MSLDIQKEKWRSSTGTPCAGKSTFGLKEPRTHGALAVGLIFVVAALSKVWSDSDQVLHVRL